MSGRAANRRQRRAAAKQLAASDTDITSLIPAPPRPAHHHWWHPEHRRWYRHDQRVLDWINVLQGLEGDQLVDEIHSRIGDGLTALVE